MFLSYQILHSSHVGVRVMNESLHKLESVFQVFEGRLIPAEENRRTIYNDRTIYSQFIESVLRCCLVWLIHILLFKIIKNPNNLFSSLLLLLFS